MIDQQEKFNTIVLSRIGFYNLAGMLEMYRRVGSATSVLEHRNDIREIVPEASPKLIDAMKNILEDLLNVTTHRLYCFIVVTQASTIRKSLTLLVHDVALSMDRT